MLYIYESSVTFHQSLSRPLSLNGLKVVCLISLCDSENTLYGMSTFSVQNSILKW